MIKYIFILLLASCVPTRKTNNTLLYVKSVSPGENGLSIYRVKSIHMRGGFRLVDSNNKYQIGTNFIIQNK